VAEHPEQSNDSDQFFIDDDELDKSTPVKHEEPEKQIIDPSKQPIYEKAKLDPGSILLIILVVALLIGVLIYLNGVFDWWIPGFKFPSVSTQITFTNMS